jgi:hypothetical protein
MCKSTDSKTARLTALALADSAASLDAERAAQAKCLIVDILQPEPTSLPDTVADLYHRWDEKAEPIHTIDYVAVCKSIGAAFDRGARCYVIRREDARRAYDALRAEGFLSSLHPCQG